MKKLAVIVSLAACLAGGGCASLTKGTTQTIALDTPGASGSNCTLQSEGIGSKTLVTPGTLLLDKSQHNIAVTCKKECYQDGVGVISSSTETMAAGNLIAGGVVGLAVDAASGAMNKYNEVNQIAMVPIAGCKPGAGPRA